VAICANKDFWQLAGESSLAPLVVIHGKQDWLINQQAASILIDYFIQLPSNF
jgi:hypothetical protein